MAKYEKGKYNNHADASSLIRILGESTAYIKYEIPYFLPNCSTATLENKHEVEAKEVLQMDMLIAPTTDTDPSANSSACLRRRSSKSSMQTVPVVYFASVLAWGRASLLS